MMASTETYVRKPQVNLLFHFLGRFIFWVMGWQVIGLPPNAPKFLVVAAPHTANQDGVMLVLTGWILRIRLDWMVKAEITRGPFGWIIKALGGVPVDRSASFDMVDQMVEQFAKRETLALIVAPEGTRKKRDHWKSGFYWIAHRANVPILCGVIDYQRKVVDMSGEVIQPSGDINADIERIWAQYRGATARYPEKVNDMRVRGGKSGQ